MASAIEEYDAPRAPDSAPAIEAALRVSDPSPVATFLYVVQWIPRYMASAIELRLLVTFEDNAAAIAAASRLTAPNPLATSRTVVLLMDHIASAMEPRFPVTLLFRA
jgi:hypothetical protein